MQQTYAKKPEHMSSFTMFIYIQHHKIFMHILNIPIVPYSSHYYSSDMLVLYVFNQLQAHVKLYKN